MFKAKKDLEESRKYEDRVIKEKRKDEDLAIKNREKMFDAIIKFSDNQACVNKAKLLLDGRLDMEFEGTSSGSFMRAVIRGDIQDAYNRGDFGNQKAFKLAKLI